MDSGTQLSSDSLLISGVMAGNRQLTEDILTASLVFLTFLLSNHR